jgi:hypothetical protein
MNLDIEKQIYQCSTSFSKIDGILKNAIECLKTIEKMTTDEINEIKGSNPSTMRKRMPRLESNIDYRGEVTDFLDVRFEEEKIKEYHDKISEIDDLYRKIKENEKLLMVEINKIKVGTLQGLSMQKMEELGASTDYTMPTDDEPLQQLMINQQSHNERDSIGGKRRTNKNKRNKANKSIKKRRHVKRKQITNIL